MGSSNGHAGCTVPSMSLKHTSLIMFCSIKVHALGMCFYTQNSRSYRKLVGFAYQLGCPKIVLTTCVYVYCAQEVHVHVV